jgi:HPt (histidine-containing phosphotransfer) domain-containing protein
VDNDPRLVAIRNRFLEKLDRRLQFIGQAWSAIVAGADPGGAATSSFYHQIHSLGGSGATFGFEELSVTARCIEALIDETFVVSVQRVELRVQIEDLLAALSDQARCAAAQPAATDRGQ